MSHIFIPCHAKERKSRLKIKLSISFSFHNNRWWLHGPTVFHEIKQQAKVFRCFFWASYYLLTEVSFLLQILNAQNNIFKRSIDHPLDFSLFWITVLINFPDPWKAAKTVLTLLPSHGSCPESGEHTWPGAESGGTHTPCINLRKISSIFN